MVNSADPPVVGLVLLLPKLAHCHLVAAVLPLGELGLLGSEEDDLRLRALPELVVADVPLHA